MALGDATIAVPNSTGSSQLPQDIGTILSLIGGIQGSGDLQKIAQTADPWGPQRGQYQTKLNDFMANPASIFTDPAFQAAENVGAENISRQAGAAGLASSGNRLAELFKFGQSSALDFEKQKFNELADLAGVNAGSPVAAAGLATGALQTQGQNLATGISGIIPLIASLLGLNTGGGLGGLLGSAGSAIGKLFGGGSPDLSTLLDQGGINAGSLDTGGTLGDLQTIDFGSGGGTVGDMAPVLDGFFQGGSGDIFQWTDTLGG